MGSIPSTTNERAGNGGHRFLLFVAGKELNSHLAQQNLEKLCSDYLEGNYEIEIIDVLKDYKKALQYRIYVTPTLKVLGPSLDVTLFGNLNNREKVLRALKFKQGIS